MCGLVGFWSLKTKVRADILKKMSDQIIHRGPDEEGQWIEQNHHLGFAHRRLSILDLSPAGSQPMHSRCGRYTIAYNGEVYNHLELRQALHDLHQKTWQGHSDTETLLEAISVWGLEKTLKKCVGMFALSLWDKKEEALYLARDRFGEKPLYYGKMGENFFFGSELKALKAHPDFKAEIDRNSLCLLLRHNYIPAPYSIYKGISKLKSGHILRFTFNDTKEICYWSLNHAVEEGLKHPFTGSFKEAADLLEDQLKNTIKDQMLSDVPLGAFLSGGIDSSTIVALMQTQSDKPVKTFTIGFGEKDFNEAVHAKEVAKHLGTEHYEQYVSAKDALEVIPQLANIYCEPFADSSQIPTYLVSKMAKQNVTVSLSGDAGDELFGGYNRYLIARDIWGKFSKLPGPLKSMASVGLKSFSPNSWDKIYQVMEPALPQTFKMRNPGEKAKKLAQVLKYKKEEEFYRELVSLNPRPEDLVLNANEPKTFLSTPDQWPKTDRFEHWMMAMDASTYMQDDILVKVDRAAMSNSLETRVPLLDHRVFELAWRMPMEYKIKGREGKRLLKEVLYRHVPAELIERPKTGFGVPLESWLRFELKDWASELLDFKLLSEQGYFNAQLVSNMWKEHLSGAKNWHHELWGILMFQDWLTLNK